VCVCVGVLCILHVKFTRRVALCLVYRKHLYLHCSLRIDAIIDRPIIELENPKYNVHLWII